MFQAVAPSSGQKHLNYCICRQTQIPNYCYPAFHFTFLYYFLLFLPRCYQLANIQCNAVGLGNKHSSNGLIQSCAIHVDCGTKRQNKTAYTSINFVMLLKAAHCSGKSCRTKEDQNAGIKIFS